jgi:hypothetical protein
MAAPFGGSALASCGNVATTSATNPVSSFISSHNIANRWINLAWTAFGAPPMCAVNSWCVSRIRRASRVRPSNLAGVARAGCGPRVRTFFRCAASIGSPSNLWRLRDPHLTDTPQWHAPPTRRSFHRAHISQEATIPLLSRFAVDVKCSRPEHERDSLTAAVMFSTFLRVPVSTYAARGVRTLFGFCSPPDARQSPCGSNAWFFPTTASARRARLQSDRRRSLRSNPRAPGPSRRTIGAPSWSD